MKREKLNSEENFNSAATSLILLPVSLSNPVALTISSRIRYCLGVIWNTLLSWCNIQRKVESICQRVSFFTIQMYVCISSLIYQSLSHPDFPDRHSERRFSVLPEWVVFNGIILHCFSCLFFYFSNNITHSCVVYK